MEQSFHHFSNSRGEIVVGPFTTEELTKLKSSLKQGKSAGPDNIPPEVLKNCELDDIILEFCNTALIENDKPTQWSQSNMIPVPKSGSLNKTDNYRGISLTCIMAKIYNRLIRHRIRAPVDPKLRYNQNGFRVKRTTVGQILALRRIIEEVKNNNLPAVLTFIDFKKAFDSIHRGKMIKILKAYGIPPLLLRAIEATYTGPTAKDGESEEFEILAGVLQGDTLAPFLFIIVLDFSMRKALKDREHLGFTITPRRSRRIGPLMLSDLDFADDIALLSNQIREAQELLDRVETECKKVGLHLNAKKTEYMAYNIIYHEPLKTDSGAALKKVDDFKYLGARMQSSEKDIKVRKALAWKALNDMRKIWSSRMSKGLKLRFCHATVETILLYGCEACIITKALSKSLDGCYTNMIRKVQNVTWKDYITNVQLYGDIPPLTEKIKSRRAQARRTLSSPPRTTSKQVNCLGA